MIELVNDPFDSEQLGRTVCKLWLRDPEPPPARELAARLARERPAMVCCFAAYSAGNIGIMQELGFRLVSVRNTYERPLAAVPAVPAAAGEVRVLLASQPARPLAEPDVLALAEVIGATSRYFKDPDIPRPLSLALYASWLSNSLYRGYADAVLLAMKGEELVGINTLKLSHDAGRIDLIGVRPAVQGAGLGNTLLLRGLEELRRLGRPLARVVTEGENVGACRFYQRHGFLLRSMELVWHRHG